MKNWCVLIFVFPLIPLFAQESKVDYFEKAIESVNKKDFAGAIYYYDKVISEQPGLVAAYYNRGNLKLHLQNLPGAKEDFSKCLQLDSNHVKSYVAMGNVFFTQQNYNQSIVYYKKALYKQADMAKAHNNLGIAYMKTEQ